MKKNLILFLILNFLCMPVLAFDLDMSVDDDIRKNYNPSKLEEDMALPALPKVLNEKPYENIKPVNQVATPPKIQKNQAPTKAPVKAQITVKSVQKATAPTRQTQSKTSIEVQAKPQPVQITQKNTDGTCAILKKGTKIRVKLLTNISDKSKKGGKVSFVSRYPVSTTYFTIPMGTAFQGEIVNSHGPQLSGNGGLIVMNINSMSINGTNQSLTASITKANNKKIFLNNIKGKRTYLKSMVKSTKPGRHFFGKMMRVTKNLATDGSSIILTPFSIIAGAGAVAGNVLVSPALALFHKGGPISIHEGSDFEIKLLQDVFIYN